MSNKLSEYPVRVGIRILSRTITVAMERSGIFFDFDHYLYEMQRYSNGE